MIRPVQAEDLSAVIALDRRNTGVAKPDYWQDVYDRYAHTARSRYFLVATVDGALAGLIIGEVRAWEFGSEPCGWVFAIQVSPDYREDRIGARLLSAVEDCFRRAGMTKMRTMLRRDEHLLMSFFRSQGLMAGPFIQLETDLGRAGRRTDGT
ncbi:MAG: GNAT family N-acetyltransferase [Alphaproteobacteria bacterium]|nr:GNAT family N-acetyltransferase [Alphaproteobacteria bacterium]